MLVSGGDDSVINLWDFRGGNLLNSYRFAATEGSGENDNGYISNMKSISVENPEKKGMFPLLAVTTNKKNAVYLLRIQSTNSSYEFHLIETIALLSLPISIGFQRTSSSNFCLWILIDDQKCVLVAYDLKLNDNLSVNYQAIDTKEINKNLAMEVSTELTTGALCARQKQDKIIRLQRIKEAEQKKKETKEKKKKKRRKKE